MKLKITDCMLGAVELDFAWGWSRDRTPQVAVQFSGTGNCSLGAIVPVGDGLKYEALLYRYGVDSLRMPRDVSAETIVRLTEAHLELVAAKLIEGAGGREN